MQYLNLIITIVSGIIGGNLSGLLMSSGLGWVANTLAGIVGGGLGTWIFQALLLLQRPGLSNTETGIDLSHLDTTMLIGLAVSSAIGGAVLTAIISWVKSYVAKNPPPQV